MTRPTNNKFILPIITFIIFLGIWKWSLLLGITNLYYYLVLFL